MGIQVILHRIPVNETLELKDVIYLCRYSSVFGQSIVITLYNRVVKRLLLFGYFGLENFGDDLLLWTICLRLGRLVEKGEIELSVLTQTPYDKLPIPARYIPRRNHTAVLKEIMRSDIVCAPGGGLLQDKTSVRSLLYYLGIINTAKALHKKVALIAQGIGPLTSSIGKKVTKNAIESVDYVSVRDQGSARQLESIGLKRKIEITSDLTFALKKTLMPGEIRPFESKGGETFNVLFCPKLTGLIDQQVARLVSAAHLIKRVFPYKDLRFSYAPLHKGQDVELSNAISERVDGSVFEYDPTSPISEYTYFNWADIVVSYRLHGCVLSAQSKRSFVAITYDPKVHAIADSFSMPALAPESLDAEELAKAVEQVYKTGFGAIQQSALTQAELDAERDINALMSLIET
jgi:polysaccharide pyruvyl transferase CsaB